PLPQPPARHAGARLVDPDRLGAARDPRRGDPPPRRPLVQPRRPVMDPLIGIESLGKRFGTVTALHEVSFGIGAGEFFSLLGASGCGKTTLLRILAGIETPTTGRVTI